MIIPPTECQYKIGYTVPRTCIRHTLENHKQLLTLAKQLWLVLLVLR